MVSGRSVCLKLGNWEPQGTTSSGHFSSGKQGGKPYLGGHILRGYVWRYLKSPWFINDHHFPKNVSRKNHGFWWFYQWFIKKNMVLSTDIFPCLVDMEVPEMGVPVVIIHWTFLDFPRNKPTILRTLHLWNPPIYNILILLELSIDNRESIDR